MVVAEDHLEGEAEGEAGADAANGRVAGGAGVGAPLPPQEEPLAFDWSAAIGAAMAQEPVVVHACDFLRLYHDDSRPVEVVCDDGHVYIVKSILLPSEARAPEAEIKNGGNPEPAQGRRMFNDQICGRLAALMQAPVPPIGLVEIPQDLIDANKKKMGHIKAGIGHASRRIPGVMPGKQFGYAYAAEGDNRQRYRDIAVFYGWVHPGDIQFLRESQPPHTVWSHDHGHFFPGGPMWTPASLAAHLQAAAPIPALVDALHLTNAELGVAKMRLGAITKEQLAAVIGSVPSTWHVDLDDRVALAKFLFKRQADLTPPPQANGDAP